jgi:hypothetical protein
MDLERLPMFGFVVDRCELCDEYRAGLQLVYETHYGGYWNPPDYTEHWICARCIEWRERSERAGDLGNWAMHVFDLEEANDPHAAEDRADLSREEQELARALASFRARHDDDGGP